MRLSDFAQTYIDRAKSTPTTLPGLEAGTEVTIAALREATSHFDRIHEAVGLMSEVSFIISRMIPYSDNDNSWSP